MFDTSKRFPIHVTPIIANVVGQKVPTLVDEEKSA